MNGQRQSERQSQSQGGGLLGSYPTSGFFCEYSRGDAEAGVAAIRDRFARFDLAELKRRAAFADAELFNLGITFTVYSDRDAIDRVLPFDVIPRLIPASEWETIERGVRQRVTAINMFLHDV